MPDTTNPSSNQAERCPQCGTSVAGGRAGCEALFDEIRFAATADRRIATVHRLAFDTYCMQHPESYCVSAKSYAAHLTGLCCGVEHNGDPAIYAAIPRWLNGSVALEKPEVLTRRGAITIANVLATPNVEARVKRIHEWADHVWGFYASQHELAQAWITAALTHKARR